MEPTNWGAAEGCASCARLQRMLGQASVGMLVIDREGRFVYTNEATLRLVGSPSAEATLAYNAFTLPTFKASGLDELVRRGLAGEELTKEIDYTSMWGKTTPMRIHLVPYREGGEVVALTISVVSRAEVALLSAENAELESAAESARMEVRALDALRDRFIATVSHELRTPLVPLLGYLRLLRGGRLGELTPEQAKAVRVASDNGERLLELVEQVLAATGEGRDIRSREMEAIDVGGLFVEARETMEPIAERHGLTVEIAVQPNTAPVRANRSKLAQVLLALLDNARKHAPPGGRVVLAAEPAGPGRVALVVADTGEPIPPEERGRIFEPFHQLGQVSTRRHGGIGLGLTIVRDIVTAHGGTIGVLDWDGFGAVFRIELPAADEAPSRQEGSSIELLHTRVLLVEGDAARRESLVALLLAHRYFVRTAASVEEAEQVLAHWAPGAVILDMEAPGAPDLLRRVRRGEQHHLAAIFGLCAEGGHARKREALDAGATAVLIEPLDEAWLLRLLGAVYPTFL